MTNYRILFLLALAYPALSMAQNVGIGITAPLQKLHVSDGALPNAATVRVDGLGTATTVPAGTAPYAVVMADANGVLYRGNPTGVTATDAWYITGNLGTTPAVNFLGTRDAQDLVIKTSGSAAANERLRVIGAGATPGQVVVNNTGIYAGDVFSVYAQGTTNGTTASINNTVGAFAISGYAPETGVGVYGEVGGGANTLGTAVWGNLYGISTAASTTSEGVYGTNGSPPLGAGVTAAVSTGVRGEATGNAGTAFTMGVLGVNTSVTGSAFGVYGQTPSPAGVGVFGVNLDATANPSHGIQGQTGAIGAAAGVRGASTAAAVGAGQSAYGVRGSVNVAPTGTGIVAGVRGDANGATGGSHGVLGRTSSATGFGLYGLNGVATGTGAILVGNNVLTLSYIGNGSGAAVNGTTIGTYSLGRTAASGTGVVAVGNDLTGSIFTLATGSGVAATGTNFGVAGYATTTVNTNGNNNATFNGVGASAGGYFEVQNATVAQTWAYVGVRDNGGTLRKIIGPGTVNTIVNDLNGNRVALSCPEATENLFQDYGSGKLVNGRAHINIDPIFARNIVVNNQHPLRVFVQLEGDCQGVYVDNKSQNGFDVVELNGGLSNVSFTYTVVANRADEVQPDGTIAKYSSERFAPAPGPQAKTVQTAELLPAAAAAPDEISSNLPHLKPKETRARGDDGR